MLERLGKRIRQTDSSIRVSVAVVVYVFAAGVGWATLSPMGGVPDEPSHIIYAAGVVRGDLGHFEVVNHPNYPQLAVVTVPEWAGSMTDPPISVDAFPFPCFATEFEKLASCAPTMSNSTVPTATPTTVTRYPPPYYWFVGLPTLFMTGESAVYTMRIVAAALAAGLIGMGLAIASPGRRTWLALGAAVAFTPMVGQYTGSINPSGMEMAAALGLGIGLMGIVDSDRRNQPRRIVLIITLATALAWSRPVTEMTLAAVIASAVLINGKELRSWLSDNITRLAVVAGLAIAAYSAITFRALYGHPEQVILSGPAGAAKSAFVPALGVDDILHQFETRSSEWLLELVGRFGWRQHLPPGSVRVGWTLLVLAILVLAIAYGRYRDRISLALIVTGALFIAPMYVMTRLISPSEYQPRYHLPLALLIVAGSVTVLSRLTPGSHRDSSWSILRWGAVLAPVAMAVSLASSLYRYSIGGQAEMSDLWNLAFGAHQWLPPNSALAIALLAVSITALTTWILVKATGKRAPPALITNSRPDDSGKVGQVG